MCACALTFSTHICLDLHEVWINTDFLLFFNPLIQNPSKASVKERLGFSTKPAAPVDKVSSALTSPTSKRLSFKNLFLFYHFSLLGVFLINGPYQDCVQPCSNNSSPEQLRGSLEEEAGKRAGNGTLFGSLLEANALTNK